LRLSAQLPASILYVDTNAKLAAKLIAASPEIETERTKLAKAELISWKAPDNLDLSGWMYKPAGNEIAKTKAKLPVIIDIHGGPEAAARPEFSPYDAYYLNSGGAAVIYPNVRGSTGRGKTFLDADNALKREDAVRDFGKLLEWIAKQPDLDSGKVMLRGFSYGGYMALLVAATFPKKVAAVSVESAPTNLVTFLETTSGWRRAQRRNEYGDERNPAIRTGLDKIAPRNLTQNLQMPLLIVHGKRDPRVPFTESEKFVAAVREKGNKNVWFLLAETDGHGLTGDNSYYSSLVAAQFFQNFVANSGKEDSSLQNQKK
jgi:dipeptidyl aminopeptidase/acylaminoacyl peptidase